MTETEKLVAALAQIAAIVNEDFGGDWDEIDKARNIAAEALTAWNTRPSVDRDAVIACIRDASDRAFEAGRKGDAHFRFGDIIARADALLSASTVEG
jgi:hypothetical protein